MPGGARSRCLFWFLQQRKLGQREEEALFLVGPQYCFFWNTTHLLHSLGEVLCRYTVLALFSLFCSSGQSPLHLTQRAELPFKLDIGKMVGPNQVNMLPDQRRQVLPDTVLDLLSLFAQLGTSTFKMAGIPNDNGVDHQAEGGGPIELGL